ncbi:unnamed protein product [Schistosoma margrebowiei]|uniref:Uncharacterized protein n=1 Tax=Schistosoma margrebowiei TaxID=48269 RepID=A0A183N6K3_9TREM|nr:unnamed protein product [Schistosoma margrebowiei]
MQHRQVALPRELSTCTHALIRVDSLLRLYGLIFSDSTGVYAFGPEVLRSLRKLESLVDNNMLQLGAQRVLLPTLGPRHIWEKSGRWSTMQSSLFRVKDRLSHEYCLQPVIYNSLTFYLYTFDASAETAEETYKRVKTAYSDLLVNLGLPYLVVSCHPMILSSGCCAGNISPDPSCYLDAVVGLVHRDNPTELYWLEHMFLYVLPCQAGRLENACADPGNVGGLISEEFHVQADVGEDRILACSKCSLKFNSELKVLNVTDWTVSYLFFKVAHCFLLGERYSKCFDATYQSPSGSKLMFMGCYGLGISRLLAVCIEHLTRVAFPDKSKDQISQLRWPVRIAPYSGSIVLQKETAKDSVNSDELKYILDTIQSDSINFKLLGDILVDDRKELSLGRKILDQSRLGIPWILIVKSQRNGTYELIDVYKDRSCVATLEQARSAFSNPAVFDASSLPSWDHRQNESNINGNKLI